MKSRLLPLPANRRRCAGRFVPGSSLPNGEPQPRGKWPHKTRVLETVRVHYPHHPQAGQEVGVLAHRRSSGTVQVLLLDETTTTLPEWMFDASYCATVVLQESACLSLSALRDLRRLVDAAWLSCDPKPKETRDERTNPPEGTALNQPDRDPGVTPREGDGGMPPTSCPDAPSRVAGEQGGSE